MGSESAKAPKIKLSLPLEYQQDLFTELRAEDGLVVLARGLGSLRIVTNLLHSYDVAGNNLIVIVGADERENAWIGEALAEHAAISRSPLARGLTQVNTDFSNVSARDKAYGQGGIFSITSRILIVDLLSKLLNPELITGLIVLHAEKVVATSTEAFIVRCYRQNNKTGFLKAFSDNPESLASGFNPLAATLRNLFLRKPSLWPRYHATVAKSLEGQKKAEVIEFDVPMTSNMRDIQNAILECVEVSISELRRSGTGIELDDWTIESALHRNFDVIIRRQLDPVWHRTNFKTRQIVSDLVVLRSMLNALLTYDAVSFHKYMEIILASHQPPPGSSRQNQSPWLYLDAANIIFDTAKRRVYTGKPQVSTNGNQIEPSLHPVLEEQPKWALLTEVLDEIERDAYLNPTIRDDSNGTILIMCSSNSVCKQVREYLQTKDVKAATGPDVDSTGDDKEGPSAAYMMRRKLRDYLMWKKNFSKANMALINENKKALEGFTDQATAAAIYKSRAPPNKRRRVRGGSAVAANDRNGTDPPIPLSTDKSANVTQLMDNIQITAEEAQQKEEIVVDELIDMEDFFELYQMEDLLVVHPFDGDMDDQILEEVRPRYIIMYEADAAFIRRIEVYRSSHNDRNIRIYFMYYGTSVEEQRYLSVVRKEKDAFTKLIKERGVRDLASNLQPLIPAEHVTYYYTRSRST